MTPVSHLSTIPVSVLWDKPTLGSWNTGCCSDCPLRRFCVATPYPLLSIWCSELRYPRVRFTRPTLCWREGAATLCISHPLLDFNWPGKTAILPWTDQGTRVDGSLPEICSKQGGASSLLSSIYFLFGVSPIYSGLD